MIPVMKPVPATLRQLQHRIDGLMPRLGSILTELMRFHPERRDAVLRAFGPLEPLIREFLDWHPERFPSIREPVKHRRPDATRLPDRPQQRPPASPRPRRAA